ncbi:hypothetical protein A2276_04685 [candidate division WOR-1 bacterium RIFOXYA12_FULL_43_27]|uniref:Peptidase M50 domain-containing protein n=1 Tax=candidate division WOR-1 bacterium RIFOXYC2_FULL_46_14 TaxID=1802587 RepID=A0A1F4U2S5_UNCSA|nr:MAG: hypothetical protein A2276_04685 [candidate division WOR-1 bacterium RIFOXYA12_FULL_43_27]OGC18879.1 MAG: hypothetical protein A2292_08150 [candidate division WOR-1 bacterium RIFOXYB2_FULL_46_45]OGC29020.1 MAG: hypothetical protein A2232_03215 [candidate division WOR-1 bacterium RIFOXYA2_FULL_46_56]OGC39278.1 MAG: hypothetical protein A2438_07115 [candidate division WOR-1 bacterium RIFOXYC2_FULL_46_14]
MGLEFFIIFLPILLISITIHEFAHAKAADILGDPTARYAGRLTLNPISHIDPLGFLALILFRIGWAKPVPINPYNFRNPERGMMIVGIAGPAANFMLAWFLAVILRNVPLNNLFWINLLQSTIWLNLALMIFNLLPVPPLDGSRIYTRFLPLNWQITLERYGFFILIGILIFPPTQELLFYAINFLFGILVG